MFSLRTIPSAWCAGRVTSTRWPNSGRDSNHAAASALRDRLADEDQPRRFQARVAPGFLQVGERAKTVRCSPHDTRSTIAAGVSGDLPCLQQLARR